MSGSSWQPRLLRWSWSPTELQSWSKGKALSLSAHRDPAGEGEPPVLTPRAQAVLGAVPQLQAQDAVRLGRGTAPALGICENTWLKERLLASIQAMLQPPPLLNPSSGWAGPPSTMKKRFKSKLPKNETGFASSVLNRCWNALKTNPSEADAQLLTSFHTRVTCSQRL